MSDYISRQAAIKRMKELHFDCKDFHICGGVLLELNALEAIPPADVRPVVFCKDCVNWDRNTIEMHDRCNNAEEGVDKTQARFAECLQFSSWAQCMMTREDDYCSLGRAIEKGD